MTDPFEKLTRTYPHYVHRVKLIPATMLGDKQTSGATAVKNGAQSEEGSRPAARQEQGSEDVMTQPLLTPEQHGYRHVQARRPVPDRPGGFAFKAQMQETMPTLPLLVPRNR